MCNYAAISDMYINWYLYSPTIKKDLKEVNRGTIHGFKKNCDLLL